MLWSMLRYFFIGWRTIVRHSSTGTCSVRLTEEEGMAAHDRRAVHNVISLMHEHGVPFNPVYWPEKPPEAPVSGFIVACAARQPLI